MHSQSPQNYQARTNYVRFKNLPGLRQALAPFSVVIKEKNGRHALFGFKSEADSVPASLLYVDRHISPFLEDGEILVVQQIGWKASTGEFTSGAWAVDSSGRWVAIEMEDIYAIAAKHFGVPLEAISRCAD
ncbi:hypothetical protein [Thiomonas sp.]